MKKYLNFLIILTLVLSISPAILAQDGDQLAPDGQAGQIYYAPISVDIELDGDTSDWEGVPTVSMEGNGHAVTFAAAANDEFLFLLGDVTDENIISGEHGSNYWDEDSVEFYVNGTGDLSLRSYQDGVAQITVPALNKDLSSEEAILSGVRGTTLNAQVEVVETDKGYLVELAIPLQNDVWDITPEHGGALGFQVHLNGATTRGRDTKLIWSIFDANDQSYQNPSVFGYLLFYEIGRTDIPELPESITAIADAPPAPVGAVYRSSVFSTSIRVADIMSYMTLDEKIGQMTLIEKGSMLFNDIAPLSIGGLLSGGGGYPNTGNTPESWAEMVDTYQEFALENRLGIPLIYGVDAVHGHSNVEGAVIFPHNIGLGATRNADLVQEICHLTALEMVATGIYWNYAPVVAVPQDIRWGRTYEAYGEDTELVTELALACFNGLQGEDLADPMTVLATPKHFVGDGGVAWGTSDHGSYFIDRGETAGDETVLRDVHLAPYIPLIENGAQSIMVSYSSWDGEKMHARRDLITDVLKGELGFRGFVVSDWQAIDEISPEYYESVVTAINAGIDMVMVPYNYFAFIDTTKAAVENGDIPIERIDDAVRRILTVKFDLGLFEQPFADASLLETVGSDERRAVARQAVAESQVLLKNDGDVLPLSADMDSILVAGVAANDIGIQSGGWTIEWQGGVGEITEGTTILEGIQNTVSDAATVHYDAAGEFSDDITGSVGIAVVGELPYAEGVGDNGELTLSEDDLQAIENLRGKVDTLIVVIVSGRPLMIADHIDDWDVVVASWLPGTEGQGVADVLFGVMPFTGKLSFTWPRSVDQLPLESIDDPLFPYGFGIETS